MPIRGTVTAAPSEPVREAGRFRCGGDRPLVRKRPLLRRRAMTSRPDRASASRRALFHLLALSVLALASAAMAEPRLGGDVVPTFEAVRLRLDPARTEYSGTVAVDLEVRRAT